MFPSPLALVVLILAAFRLWRLLAEDDLPPLARARDWLTGAQREDGEWSFRRPTLAHFLACPYCLGAWVSLAVYAAWLSAPVPTLYAMTPFAISGAVGLIAANLGD